MDITLTPLGNRVLIKPEEAAKQTESGILLAEDWKPEQTGIVVAIGPTFCPRCQKTHPPDFAVGDQVIFSWQVGQEVFVNDGERFLMMGVGDVMARIEEGQPA